MSNFPIDYETIVPLILDGSVLQADVASAIRHAEQRLDVAFSLLAIVTPLVIGGGFVYVVARHIVPAWREEKPADRNHLSAQLRYIRDDAMKDTLAARQHAQEQHDSIVTHIGEELERFSVRTMSEPQAVGERAERHGELIHRIAAKVGAAAVLVSLGVAGFSVLSTYVAVGFVLDYKQARAQQRLPPELRTDTQVRYTCEPRCKPGDYCCADRDHPNRCCPDSVRTASPPRLPIEARMTQSRRKPTCPDKSSPAC